MAYQPTLNLIDFYGKCRSIYESHGSYGLLNIGQATLDPCWVLPLLLQPHRPTRHWALSPGGGWCCHGEYAGWLVGWLVGGSTKRWLSNPGIFRFKTLERTEDSFSATKNILTFANFTSPQDWWGWILPSSSLMLKVEEQKIQRVFFLNVPFLNIIETTNKHHVP